jgi:membrane fusion protein (multidrug efflux system)
MRIPLTGGRRPGPWAEKWLAILGILTIALGLAMTLGCGDSSRAQSGSSGGTPTANQNADDEEPEEDAIAIEVGAVAHGSLSSIYSTSATLRADKRATVTARTKGVIQMLLVEEGDWVKKDQPLAILENDEQQIAFDQASATYETKRRELERAESLHAQDLLSEEEYETTRRESVEAEHTAALAELTLSRTVIRATFAGRVLTRHVDVGAIVNDGTSVYDIADLDPLYADVQVPERQVAQLKPGQTVRLVTDDDVGSGEAEIERIAPAVDPSTGTVKVTLAVRRAGSLRPGSFVRVGIVTDTHDNALVVPRSALVAEGRRWHLFRIKDDDAKHVELIEVTRGFEEAERVEILADSSADRPLRVGDTIVVTGASSLDDGSAVQVLTEEADELAGEGEPEDEAAEASNDGQDEEAQGVAA